MREAIRVHQRLTERIIWTSPTKAHTATSYFHEIEPRLMEVRRTLVDIGVDAHEGTTLFSMHALRRPPTEPEALRWRRVEVYLEDNKDGEKSK